MRKTTRKTPASDLVTAVEQFIIQRFIAEPLVMHGRIVQPFIVEPLVRRSRIVQRTLIRRSLTDGRCGSRSVIGGGRVGEGVAFRVGRPQDRSVTGGAPMRLRVFGF
jgi:hypothetical protein